MDILKLYKEDCGSKIQEIRKRCVCRLNIDNLCFFENSYL
jgi:hypothetical protein